MSQAGRWFDGEVATSQPVTVTASATALDIVTDGGRQLSVAIDQLVRMSGASGRVRLGHRAIEG